MDTAGLINSSLDGIPILPREPLLLFASGASSLCGSLIGSEELQNEKSSCSFRQTSNNLFLLFSIYVCMYTLFYTTHKRRRCIYLLSCFSSSFSISLSVYVNSRKHFAPRCGDYITARATVKIHQRWLYISLCTSRSTFRDTRYIAHNYRRHCWSRIDVAEDTSCRRLIRFTAR